MSIISAEMGNASIPQVGEEQELLVLLAKCQAQYHPAIVYAVISTDAKSPIDSIELYYNRESAEERRDAACGLQLGYIIKEMEISE